MGIFITTDTVRGLEVNGSDLAEIAEKNHGYFLEHRDLRAAFDLEFSESRELMQSIKEILKQKDASTRRQIFFGRSDEGNFEIRQSGSLSEKLAMENWHPDNYATMCDWLDRLPSETEKTVVLTDCDNTLWAGDIGDSCFFAAVEMGKISWKNAPELNGYSVKTAIRDLSAEADSATRKQIKKNGISPADYYLWLYDQDPTLSYNYCAQAWAGLTLNDVNDVYKKAVEAGSFPQVYSEMKNLFNMLYAEGVCTGYVSASPIFLVLPMLEHAGFNAPLAYVEGIDCYVTGAGTDDDKPVLLSNLLQADGAVNSWSDILEKFGDLKITSLVSGVGNFREGKAVGGSSIVNRHVLNWNRSHLEDNKRISLSEMRLTGVFGDNFGAFSDLPGADPSERGNDHGMLRSLTPHDDVFLVADIYPVSVKDDGTPDFEKKKKTLDSFEMLAAQLQQTNETTTFLVQPAIYRGDKRGFIAPDSVSAYPSPGEVSHA